jgi:hypothetical protein
MAVVVMAGTAMAQVNNSPEDGSTSPTVAAQQSDTDAKPKCPPSKIQHIRPTSQCGLNMFEPPKEEADATPFKELAIDWGVAFSQTYQRLKHRNTALPNINASGVNLNQLANIGPGFNLAAANLYLNGQIADGVRLSLTVYLSARHHNEVWVKDGYILMDKSPINLKFYNGIANTLWEKYVTVKVGHFEINYGDAHFRRTDNGMGMYNPFIGNYLLDAFTTEIGGELYLRAKGILAMGSITGGEIKGNVLSPQSRSPAFISKLGFDRQITPDLRVRLTGSNYTIRKSPADTLYAGDRGGSPYFFVLENTQATATANAFSGTINPGFSYRVQAYQVNPFVKYRGLEFFGVFEHASGSTASETKDRAWTQQGGEAVYRFADNHLFVGARYNRAKGRLANMANELSVNRTQFGAGWFINRYLLLKSEYVIQNHKNFPATDIRNGGRFQGWMFDAVLAF